MVRDRYVGDAFEIRERCMGRAWIAVLSLSLGGSLTFIEAGIVLCFSARITLSMPAQPATALRWPILLLIEPTATRSRCGLDSFALPCAMVLGRAITLSLG